jgi:putative ABC transport system permease protein
VTALLMRLLGRLPIGWLQLMHNKTRLASALAGVTFANVLIFVQLGFFGALVGSIRLPYDRLDGDLLISASDMNTLSDGGPLPRQRMLEALGVEGVESAVPIYHGRVEWKQPDGTTRGLDVLGVDPFARALRLPGLDAWRPELMLPGRALIDRRTRNVPARVFAAIEGGRALEFEAQGVSLTIPGTIEIGGGFSSDGYLIVSEQTFFRMFPRRIPGAPSQILVRLAPGAAAAPVVAALRGKLSPRDSIVRTVGEAFARDQTFQTTQRPVGIIFGFGVAMGVLVGIIIVYQVLSTDVADHLREYATFKAIGHDHRYFLGIIFEEALLLATLGFVPGLLLSLGVYAGVARATGLPLSMSPGRAAAVLLGTIAMCSLSGALATRRLAKANPAELFA